MKPYHADDWLTVYQGDCREVMRQMEPESVHCVVTSPPYWGLRDYGTASWVGGDEGCDHKGRDHSQRDAPHGVYSDTRGTQAAKQRRHIDRETCHRCGATRIDSQLGLEATPEEFVANMVDVFREVKRVLRKDGTCWVNLGDSYAGSPPSGGSVFDNGRTDGRVTYEADKPRGRRERPLMAPGLKPKDLVGIPWRVAFALQADGWYLRSDIIWAKPNPMPESVTDRPTKSHEYLFLLTKSARYYYDADAVREPQDEPGRVQRHGGGTRRDADRVFGRTDHEVALSYYHPAGRNLRTVWTIATAPYPGAHFATFPPKLVEPCIKAGAPEKVCGECGAGWRRVTEVTQVPTQATNGHEKQEEVTGWDRDKWPRTAKDVRTLGFIPSCKHDAETVPATVLDPFAGSGTVGMVAQSLSRRAVLIDLNGDYLVQAMSRNQQSPLGLETV